MRIKNIEFFCDDSERFMQQRTDCGANVVVTDPPRAGCSKKFLDAICTLSPQKVVYISCNVDSLARDLLEWLSEDEVTEFCRVYGYEHPEPEDDEYDEIEEATSINSSRYVNVMTLSVGDCIKEDDGCYLITDISKGAGGVYKFVFSDGSTAYYDSNDQVLVED